MWGPSMGIDIFMYAERCVEGSWTLAEPIESNPEREWADAAARELDEWAQVLDHEEWLTFAPELHEAVRTPQFMPRNRFQGRSRNGALWCILGHSQGRKHSVTPYEPIVTARGLPADLSPELGEWTAYAVEEPSNSSWLLLRVLLDFDWQGKTIVKTAMVDRKVVHLFAPQPQQATRLGFPWSEWPVGIPISYASYMR